MSCIRQENVRNTVVNHRPGLRPVFNALPPYTDRTVSPGADTVLVARTYNSQVMRRKYR